MEHAADEVYRATEGREREKGTGDIRADRTVNTLARQTSRGLFSAPKFPRRGVTEIPKRLPHDFAERLLATGKLMRLYSLPVFNRQTHPLSRLDSYWVAIAHRVYFNLFKSGDTKPETSGTGNFPSSNIRIHCTSKTRLRVEPKYWSSRETVSPVNGTRPDGYDKTVQNASPYLLGRFFRFASGFPISSMIYDTRKRPAQRAVRCSRHEKPARHFNFRDNLSLHRSRNEREIL